MASDLSFVLYVTDSVKGSGIIEHKKMFGEYLVYANGKPAFLICDNTVYVKMWDFLADRLGKAEIGEPYKGAKPHYMVDPDDCGLMREVVRDICKLAPVPKPKRKKPTV